MSTTVSRDRLLWLFVLVAALLAGGPRPARSAGEAGPQTEFLATDDGVSFVVDFYRPDSAVSGVLVFFSDRGERPGDWAPLARDLAAAGFVVGVTQLRPPGGEAGRMIWGRAEEPYGNWTETWREAQAVAAHARAFAPGPAVPLVLAGAGQAAAAVAIAASRLPVPPAALMLLRPAADLAGIPITPVLAGLERPTLIVAPLTESPDREVARDIYLSLRAQGELWETDLPGTPAAVLAARGELRVDAAGWLAGVLAAGASPGGGDRSSPGGRP